MGRRLLVLKAVLLWRHTNRHLSKEEQMRMVGLMDDGTIREWITMLQDPNPEQHEEDGYWDGPDSECREEYTPSCTAGDYSPSAPWNAPGMSIRDFI